MCQEDTIAEGLIPMRSTEQTPATVAVAGGDGAAAAAAAAATQEGRGSSSGA
jgi:hypothetical protein